MDEQRTNRPSRRGIKMAVIAAVFAAVIAPIAVTAATDFVDVPDTNVFHDHIDWMSDSGITAGCNPPANDMYCPGANVTREQMAAFMNRLADNQVVDAAELMGSGPDTYTNAAYGGSCNGTTCPDGASFTRVALIELEITAPEAGYLTVGTNYSVQSSAPSSDIVQTWVAMDTETDCGGWFIGPLEHVPGSYTVSTLDGNVISTTAASHVVTAVSAGSHTVQLCALGSEAIQSQHGSITATFSSVGAVTPVPAAAPAEVEYANIKDIVGDVDALD